MTLKFETLAEIGQTIKAYDHQPMSDRPDYYVVGVVTGKGMTEHGFAAYTISVTEDTVFTEEARIEVLVPFEVGFMEYDERVSLV